MSAKKALILLSFYLIENKKSPKMGQKNGHSVSDYTIKKIKKADRFIKNPSACTLKVFNIKFCGNFSDFAHRFAVCRRKQSVELPMLWLYQHKFFG